MNKFFDEFFVYATSKSTLINKLLQKNVKIFKVESAKNGIKICVKPRDRQKVIEIFGALCYNYEIVKGIDKKSIVAFLRNRWAMVVFFALFIVTLALVPRFVYTVSVDAPSYLFDEVQSVLSAHGVSRWQKTKNIDCDAVEKDLSAIDGVSFADVKTKGSVVYVGVRPSLKKPEIADVHNNTPVIATVDAVITRQIVFSGTAVYSAGDEVKAGDALILPKIVAGDEEIGAQANGEVYGIIGYSSTVAYSGAMTTFEKSGNTKTFRVVEFLGLKGKTPKSPYKLYETRKRKVESGFLIPLGFLEITFDEIVEKTINLPFDRAKDDVIKRASEQAEKVVPYGARVVRREINVSEAGGVHYVTATVYAEGRIDASQ